VQLRPDPADQFAEHAGAFLIREASARLRANITSWRIGRTPVTVEAQLGELLPPVIRGQAIFTGRADWSRQRRSAGWRNLLWPTATTAPPALIGIADAPALGELIATAQLASRAPAQRAQQKQPTAVKDPN
jgi:hypothetical protein